MQLKQGGAQTFWGSCWWWGGWCHWQVLQYDTWLHAIRKERTRGRKRRERKKEWLQNLGVQGKGRLVSKTFKRTNQISNSLTSCQQQQQSFLALIRSWDTEFWSMQPSWGGVWSWYISHQSAASMAMNNKTHNYHCNECYHYPPAVESCVEPNREQHRQEFRLQICT